MTVNLLALLEIKVLSKNEMKKQQNTISLFS